MRQQASVSSDHCNAKLFRFINGLVAYVKHNVVAFLWIFSVDDLNLHNHTD